MKYQPLFFYDNHLPSLREEEEIVDFLCKALEEYGDPKQDIEECVSYALKKIPSFGGLVAIVRDTEEPRAPIIGCVVFNRTGMRKFIPENILVYIATDKDYRGRGIGRLLIEESLKELEGSVALHCEPHNPARHLYEKLGFTSKYLEMRLIRK